MAGMVLSYGYESVLECYCMQNWIRQRNMKQRAGELGRGTIEPTHALPLKKVRLTPWQQHLKNYTKTEGNSEHNRLP